MNNIAVVCVIAKLRRPVSANFWVNTNDPDMDIPGIVEYTNLRPMDAHIVYVPFYMPGEHERHGDSDDVFAGKVRRYLCMINPQLGADDFIDVRVSRYRHAQPICEPGFGPAAAAPAAGGRTVGGRYLALLPRRPRHLREHRLRRAMAREAVA